MPANENDPLSYMRIMEARETLSEAFGKCYGDEPFPGAVDADPSMAFSEAKRNLGTLISWLHGEEMFEIMLKQDGG